MISSRLSRDVEPYYWEENIEIYDTKERYIQGLLKPSLFSNLANIFFFDRKKWAVIQICKHF